jgi:DNA-directed RNA polymerase subunit K
MKGKETYTRYEKTRIISARALQIAHGGPVLTKVPKGVIDPIEIAKLEWEAGVIPIDIKIQDDEPVTIEEEAGAEPGEGTESQAGGKKEKTQK